MSESKCKFPCPDCDAVFSRKRGLHEHQQKSCPANPFCDACSYNIPKDEWDAHPEECDARVMTCKTCHNTFTLASLVDHVLICQQDMLSPPRLKPQFSCPHCGKVYVKMESLRKHLNKHPEQNESA
ncbi:hypothetical protein BC936DRAFT_146035 [Jimgerdemannia flammicorona]|uniref:Uncharacterized protein n=2 Tax=Jimgerdemannia flammicorona TaxID=994334 RepID=A0A433QAW7_9FUNG|nr:hypothetical protein BC936DRAFT_146035 [Jimgerdemannia flammicorona]RUS26869.1 hypothetical protein BC938DRAFT_484011 [Jimgerdemannia flammicorona]